MNQQNKSLLKVVKNEKSDVTPIWLMRQAGRYLPEYMKVRRKHNDFIKFILNSDAAAEVTLQPIDRFDINGAIIFSDILIVPYAMGIEVNFIEGKGPVITPPKKRLEIDMERQSDVYRNIYKTIRIVASELKKNGKDVTLIGFAGSPWTVMCYIIEGSLSKNFEKVRSFYLNNMKEWNYMVDQLIESTISYILGQIESGAESIQLFDSWAGIVPAYDFERLIIAPTKKIVQSIKAKYPHIPIIGFPKNAGLMYNSYAEETGIDVLSIDQNVPLLWAKNNLMKKIPLQGNMDNMILATSPKIIPNAVDEIFKHFESGKFIFNLGHGILPQTNFEDVYRLIECVRKHDR